MLDHTFAVGSPNLFSKGEFHLAVQPSEKPHSLLDDVLLDATDTRSTLKGTA